MTKQGRKILVALFLVLVLISASSEFASMARQLSIWDALASFALISLIILGAVYWIKRSKSGK